MELRRIAAPVGAALILCPAAAQAASLDGAQMGWIWAAPFAGILLSIAVCPLLVPRIWHDHYGKIAAVWAALTLLPLWLAFGSEAVLPAFVHMVLDDYVSFILMLFALYTAAGGLLITGNLGGRPLSNTLVLAFGTSIASLVGTTGAAMILVRPLIRANATRKNNAHVIVFFIFLVGNIGGALTPIGDPPLLIGFLRGVDFFWPAVHLWRATLVASVLILAIFLVLDSVLIRRDPPTNLAAPPMQIRGTVNFALIGCIVGAIILSSVWKPGIGFDLQGTRFELQNLVRDASFLVIALVSLRLTPEEHRAANEFTWEPIREVAKLFAAIFVCIIPVMAMLQAGHNGPFARLLGLISRPDGTPNEIAYFWLTGLLSAFLDNAPTYLVFFHLAGADPAELMNRLAPTLTAISMGAVYVGALTYIGNAPNLMVAAIATARGVKMPSFFGYFGWACVVLLPVFALLNWMIVK